ncbi:MAG: RIP metalloprotease RseP [Candidatus Marinimicrobia bacterium]|jgi:regulator of sigma E protease|nr:RIP metalloprotease RseP [Candidatus Neomarinimicrobiota bacterium]MBT3675184.1 RIP metalloprotease RseP [Candidatus Neomarinimicrobiota bacterium]MBT3763894.1 RIP metalloprotease RseP [Candidatus Neomarinimicrobiota bacterium]MBT4271339.1 RIP metalloprotease RseP [Candidatus Neomarinimicrobiota bacterium]MBT4371994.1 RIP metalloprotease RseP [Candidatus Neomarinimicrobiota bacterium]
MTTLIATIILLGVLIFIHELGHYLAARSIGVRVERFSIGYPPRLMTFTSISDGWEFRFFFYHKNEDGKWAWGPVKSTSISRPGRKGSGTEYCFAVIPFGGYVKVAGVIDESMDATFEHKPYELMSKTKLQQIWFMSAGVIMNTLLAFIIFTGLSNYSGKPVISNEPVINELLPGMPAEISGLKSGDEIKAIEGNKILSWDDLTKEIHQRPNQQINLTYSRGDESKSISLESSFQLNPTTGDTVGVIGIYPKFEYQPVTFTEGVSMGAMATARGFGIIILSIKMLTSGQASIKELGGPIMIAQLAGETAKAGWIPFLSLMALISCNLAFLNILPIPGLDGGHIFITLIEGIIRRPLSMKMRMAIQQIGMVLLLMLMITVIVNDVGRLLGN